MMNLIGVVLGALLCGLPALLYGAYAPGWQVLFLVLPAVATGLALLRPGVRWQVGGGVGFGLVIYVFVRIIVDYLQNPASHNLAPFEILLGLVAGLLPAALAVALGNWLRRRMPTPEGTGLTLVALALIGFSAHIAYTIYDMARVSAHTQQKMADILAGEYAFRAANPARGFTCDLMELHVPFAGTVTDIHPDEHYRRADIVYRGGTAATDGDYRYALKCDGSPDPQSRFVLTAKVSMEKESSARPLPIFCAGPEGLIHSVPPRHLYACFLEGKVVQEVK